MRNAQFSGKLDARFNPFDDDHLAEIVSSIVKAWHLMTGPSPGELEDSITFRLFASIVNDPVFRDLPYDVATQHWLAGSDGSRLGRLDLHFKHRHSRRDYFAFEAKRLHVRYPGGNRSTEYSSYVSRAGMGAFIVSQYSNGLPAAGMIAYVMDGLSEKAWSGISKQIDAKRKLLKLDGSLTLSQALGQINSASGVVLGETGHLLQNRRLRMLHLILPAVTPNLAGTPAPRVKSLN